MPTPTLYRERDIRRAIVLILESTRAFDGVYSRALSEVPGRAAGDARAVSIEPDATEFSSPWGDGDPSALVISGRLSLTFMVRHLDPDTRDDQAERLVNIASNALNDASLAGLTMPSFTRFRSIKWLTPEPPERRIAATFEYRYAIDTWNTFDITE